MHQSASAQDAVSGALARLSADAALREQFVTEGYIGPFRLSGVKPGRLLLERYFPSRFLTWYKSLHEKSAPVLRAAAAPDITNVLQQVLGEDILIWGSIFIGQKPDQAHNWHLDVEYGGDCKGATLWLGLKNLTSKTSVSVITHSHLLQTAPQELKEKFGVDTRDDGAMLAAAKKLDPRCELKTFHLTPGEFIIWSGRAWHATLNKSDKTRFSIILQYCTPDNVPRAPLNYDYPDTKWADVQPPCVMVRGSDRYHRNKMVRKSDVERLYAWLRPLYLSLCGIKHLLWHVKQKAMAR